MIFRDISEDKISAIENNLLTKHFTLILLKKDLNQTELYKLTQSN